MKFVQGQRFIKKIIMIKREYKANLQSSTLPSCRQQQSSSYANYQENGQNLEEMQSAEFSPGPTKTMQSVIGIESLK